eukprot:scaffold12.g8046.t1
MPRMVNRVLSMSEAGWGASRSSSSSSEQGDGPAPGNGTAQQQQQQQQEQQAAAAERWVQFASVSSVMRSLEDSGPLQSATAAATSAGPAGMGAGQGGGAASGAAPPGSGGRGSGGSGMARRTLEEYLALPPDEYSLLDPRWISRGEGGAFRVTIPLRDLVGIELQPTIEVVAHPEPGTSRAVTLVGTKAALGSPAVDEAFRLTMVAVVSDHRRRLPHLPRPPDHLPGRPVYRLRRWAARMRGRAWPPAEQEPPAEGRAAALLAPGPAAPPLGAPPGSPADDGSGATAAAGLAAAASASAPHLAPLPEEHVYISQDEEEEHTAMDAGDGLGSTESSLAGWTAAERPPSTPQPARRPQARQAPAQEQLAVRVQVTMAVRVPAPLRVVPTPILGHAGSLVLRAALSAVLPNLADLLVADYRRWSACGGSGNRGTDADAGVGSLFSRLCTCLSSWHQHIDSGSGGDSQFGCSDRSEWASAAPLPTPQRRAPADSATEQPLTYPWELDAGRPGSSLAPKSQPPPSAQEPPPERGTLATAAGPPSDGDGEDGGAAAHAAAVRAVAEAAAARGWANAPHRPSAPAPEVTAAVLRNSATSLASLVQQLFPGLPAAACQYLLHCLFEALLAPTHPRPAGRDWLLAPAAAAAAAAMVGWLAVHIMTAPAFPPDRSSSKRLTQQALLTLLTPVHGSLLALAAQRLALEPRLAAPKLAAVADGRRGGLPPPPPPPPARGAVAPLPAALRHVMGETGEGGPLRRLLAAAVAGLETSAALAQGPSAASSAGGAGGTSGACRPGLQVGPDIDFGVVPLVAPSASELEAVAASVACQWAAGSGGDRGAEPTSLLQLLMLDGPLAGSAAPSATASSSGAGAAEPAAAAPAAEDAARGGGAAGGTAGRGGGAGGAGPSSLSSPLLHFRQLTVDNRGEEEVLLIGGVAAPRYPHTLAAIDEAQLFWTTEGQHRCVRLGPQQQHAITLALSAAASRHQELGLLQCLLLLLVAVPPSSRLGQELLLHSVPHLDVFAPAQPGAASGSRAGGEAPEPAAAPAGAASAPRVVFRPAAGAAPSPAAGGPAGGTGAEGLAFSVFVVTRRATVALVRRPGELSSLLSSEAKPFISETLRSLFSRAPSTFLGDHTQDVRRLFGVEGAAKAPQAHQQQGAASRRPQPARPPRPPPGIPRPSVALLQLVRRYSRLLILEEHAQEEEACRHDCHHARLQLAVFGLAPQPSPAPDAAGGAAAAVGRRYCLLPLPLDRGGRGSSEGGEGGGGSEQQGRGGLGLFRGPSPARLMRGAAAGSGGRSGAAAAERRGRSGQGAEAGEGAGGPAGGAGGAAEAAGHPLCVLGVLAVPGLPEKRPAIAPGSLVYLRPAADEGCEIGTIAAAAEGDRVFLVLPPAFWGESWPTGAPTALLPALRAAAAAVAAAAEGGGAGGGEAEARAAAAAAQAAAERRQQGHQAAAEGVPSPPLWDGLVHVRFSFDRNPIVRMHAALAAAVAWDATLLHHPVPPVPPEQLAALAPTGKQVAAAAAGIVEAGSCRLNSEQRQAVAAVVCGAGRAAPYALFGPPGERARPCTSVAASAWRAPSAARCMPVPLRCVSSVWPWSQYMERPTWSAHVARLLAAGTGKTVTLVECALQLLARYPDCRLLLAAPQAYSADLLCSTLAAAGCGQEQMVRANDPRRPAFEVKQDVLPFCQYDEGRGMFAKPSAASLAGHQVVVVTCTGAGMLHEGRHAAPAFTHVLVDEAGQALLPEALIPLALLGRPAGGAAAAAADAGWGALLCGDPRQLGPIVHSQTAAAAGLATSLLELCIAHHAAAAQALLAQGLCPSTTTLVRNYRSHKRLLELPSKLFYGASLVAAADQRTGTPGRQRRRRRRCCVAARPAGASRSRRAHAPGRHPLLPPRWEELEGLEEGERQPERRAATAAEGGTREAGAEEEEGAEFEAPAANLLFYGVRGQQMREGDAPSFFNPIEASVLVGLVTGLLAAAGGGVTPDDIGVIATYRKQAHARVQHDGTSAGGQRGPPARARGGRRADDADAAPLAPRRAQVQQVRLLLRQRGLAAVRVGSVDDYQGQEERVIFISTVLSRPESLPGRGADGRLPAPGGRPTVGALGLGFFGNPRRVCLRFNVAVTRARALLVVVGHPAVLLEDASWRELLCYCFSRGLYKGAGSAAIRARFRIDPGAAAADLRPGRRGAAARSAAAGGGGGKQGGGAEGQAGGGGAGAAGGDEEEREEEQAAEGAEGEGAEGEGEDDLQEAMGRLAELALLGAGDADRMFPQSPEEMGEAFDTEWRIAL